MQLTSTLPALGLMALSVINGISAAPHHQDSTRDVASLQARGPLEDYQEAKKKVEDGGKVVNMDDDAQFVKNDKDIGSFTFNACVGTAILGKKGSVVGHYSCFASGKDWKPAKDIPKVWDEHKDDLEEDTKTYVYAMQKSPDGGWEDEGRVDEIKKIVKDTTGKDPEVVGYIGQMGLMDDYGNIKKEYNRDKAFSLKGGFAVIHKSTLGVDRDGPADIVFFKAKDQAESCKA